MFHAALRWILGLFDLAFRELETIEPYRERAEQKASDYREVAGALRGRPGRSSARSARGA